MGVKPGNPPAGFPMNPSEGLPIPPIGVGTPRPAAPSIGSNLPPLGGQFPPLPTGNNNGPGTGSLIPPLPTKDPGLSAVQQNTVCEERAQPGEVTFAQVLKRLYDSDRLGDALWAYNRLRNGELREGPGGSAPRLNPGDKILVPPINLLERESGITPPSGVNTASGTSLPGSPIRVGQPTPIPALVKPSAIASLGRFEEISDPSRGTAYSQGG